MKISVNKILFYKRKLLNNFKRITFQLSLLWNPQLNLCFEIDGVKSMGNIFWIRFNFFNLFHLDIRKDEELDHAGFHFTCNILGLDCDFNYEDQRHWDYQKDCWEEFN